MYLIFADLRIFGAEELSQKIKYGYRNYDNYMHTGVSDSEYLLGIDK
jgi:hypothetical protein